MADDQNETRVAPPYTSFQSLKTFIASLQEHGLPSRIDRSILTNFSGSVGKQLLTALRFLGLVNDGNVPSDDLRALVTAYGKPDWKRALADVLGVAYRPIFQIDLATATPSLFSEHFRRTYNGAEAVARKSMTFFLAAAREADIQISPRILSGTKPRTAPTKRRQQRPPKVSGSEKGQQHTTPPTGNTSTNTGTPKTASQVVFEALNPSEMPPDVVQATLTLLTYLKAKGL